MAKTITRTKPLHKTVGFYFVLIYAIITTLFIYQAYALNLIPMKYLLPVSAVLVLFLFMLGYLQIGKHVNKINRVLGKLLIVVLSVILGAGNWYIYHTGSFFRNMIFNGKDVIVVSVVVKKDSGYDTIDDLKNKTVGSISLGDAETMAKAITDLKDDLNGKVEMENYTSYKTYAEALYDGEVDAVLLNEGSRGLMEDSKSSFTSDTKVIKQYTFEKDAKQVSKGVNVTKKPFNVYITGIDTYGSLGTVSRSDVNMIVSINPITHQILMLGIPRDYYVAQTCQDNQLDKLTHTGMFGVDCTIETMENVMDIDLNYYARVNFSSLVDIVDALGGVDVESPFAFQSKFGYLYQEGMNHLNGEEALGFARERKNLADGDNERSRNQMRLLKAIINKAISPSIITNYTDVLEAVSGSFQTNMTQNEMTAFVKAQLNSMKGWDIKQIQLKGEGATKWTPANGFDAYVMIPEEGSIESAHNLIEKLHNGELITDEDVEYHENQMYLYETDEVVEDVE